MKTIIRNERSYLTCDAYEVWRHRAWMWQRFGLLEYLGRTPEGRTRSGYARPEDLLQVGTDRFQREELPRCVHKYDLEDNAYDRSWFDHGPIPVRVDSLPEREAQGGVREAEHSQGRDGAPEAPAALGSDTGNVGEPARAVGAEKSDEIVW